MSDAKTYIKRKFKLKIIIITLLSSLLLVATLFFYYPQLFISPKAIFAFVESKKIKQNFNSISNFINTTPHLLPKKALDNPSKITYSISNINLDKSNTLKISPDILNTLKDIVISGELELDLKNNYFKNDTSLGYGPFKFFKLNIIQNKNQLSLYAPYFYDKYIGLDRTRIDKISVLKDLNLPIKRFEFTEFLNILKLSKEEQNSLIEVFKKYPKDIFHSINKENFKYYNNVIYENSSNSLNCKKISLNITSNDLKTIFIDSLNKFCQEQTIHKILERRFENTIQFLNNSGIEISNISFSDFKNLATKSLISKVQSTILESAYDITYEIYFDNTFNLIGRKILLKNTNKKIFEFVIYEKIIQDEKTYSMEFKEKNDGLVQKNIKSEYTFRDSSEYNGFAKYNHNAILNLFGQDISSNIIIDMDYYFRPKINNFEIDYLISSNHVLNSKQLNIDFTLKTSYLFNTPITPIILNKDDIYYLNESSTKEDLDNILNRFKNFFMRLKGGNFF